MNGTQNQASCKDIFEKRGEKALEEAKAIILASEYDNGLIASALKYFAKKTMNKALPVFPALTSLSCEAVGGDPKKTSEISAALTLIAGAADIQDDIIDKSISKYSRKTVFGKYGEEIGLLAGDALLIQGMTLLNESKLLLESQKSQVLKELFNSFMKISKAEALEVELRKSSSISPKKYLQLIELKSSVPEMHCRIGALMGAADDLNINEMGKFGRIFGFVSLILEEFADMYDFEEFQRRIENECPPLPFLYALESEKAKNELTRTFSKKVLNPDDFQRYLHITFESKGVRHLLKKMENSINSELVEIDFIADKKIRAEASKLFSELLEAVEDYETLAVS